MGHKHTAGHLLALLTIVIWGTTFISTKVLLTAFRPVEILFVRLLIGLLALYAANPRRMRIPRRQEVLFALAGLCGICLYYLMETMALTFTATANVSVVVSIAPFFTAILSCIVSRGEEKLRAHFFIGFAVAIAGVCLISYNGSKLKLNPLGDLLAALAALSWAFYSLIIRKISSLGYPTVQATRRVFAYGILWMVPALFIFGFKPEMRRLIDPVNLSNFLFLGLGASALCFATWGFAVKTLGAIKTSVYIYAVPAVTAATSLIALGERITPVSAAGIALALAGLVLSQGNPLRRRS